MTPPTVPPDKRPDRFYDFGRMNMAFALSSLGLLGVTLWMAFADYAQPWKRFQAEFRSLERAKLAREAGQERQRLSQNDIAQLKQEIAAEQGKLAASRREIEGLLEQIARLKTEVYSADSAWKGAKATFDARTFQLDAAVQSKGEAGATAEKKRFDAAADRLREAKKSLEEASDQLSGVQAKLAEKRSLETAAEAKLKALNEGVANLEQRMDVLKKDFDYFALNAPLTDFMRPSLKVEQAILPGLFHNINFTNIDRVDRCMTCHVAANRPGFEDDPTTPQAEWSEPFRSHPRLDLFVGDSSPHPYTRFGCTACHGGLDRATDFARAGHSPRSEEEKKEWEKRWGWKEQPFLEMPILPVGLTEAGCVTCHAAEVWTPKSEVQEVGRELISHMGCYGCHTIGYPAFTGLRKAGPSLLRIAGKTSPGWAYKWIEAPRDFHPTTFMPHFFFQENVSTAENKQLQGVEIAALVAYLWDKSEKPSYDDAAVPAGDAARGKQLFETVGCAGCHILDGNAKRDDFYPVVNRLHGPNLVRTGSKVGKGWLFAWIKNPKQYFPDTNMPNLRLTDQEAADLVAYLTEHNRDAKYENPKVPEVDRKVRDRLALEYLQNVNTIERSQAKLGAMSEKERTVYLGEQTVAKYGCYGCHDIAGFENAKPIGTELTQEGSKTLHQFDFAHVHEVPHTRHDWIFNKLLRPRRWDEGKEEVKSYNELLKMPNFGMSEREAKAVLSNVLGFTKESAVATRRAGGDARAAAVAEGRKLITRFNCQGCHLIEGHGHAIKSVITDPALLPPNLASQGARVQPAWLFDFLHDPGTIQMRPWLSVRMPTFGFSDAQDNAVISYFSARDGRAAFLSAPPPPDPKSLAVGGVVFSMLQCARCHPTGPVTAGIGASKAELAPSLLLARGRLRHDWVPDWIKNPQGWVPGTRMPNFFLEVKPGELMSPIPPMLGTPTFAGQKQQLLRYFSSEAEMTAYLADPDKVTVALRDHVWSLSAGTSAAGGGATAGGGR